MCRDRIRPRPERVRLPPVENGERVTFLIRRRVVEEAREVALTSGGFSWRRKRGKAERLRPVAEDATSTTQLFHARRRRPRPSPAPEPAAPSSRRAYEPLPDDAGRPLVRYEWRTAAG